MDESFDAKIGKVVRRRRKALGLGQDVMAEVLGVSRGAVSNMETGRHVWYAERIAWAARYFNCTAAEIVAEAEGIGEAEGGLSAPLSWRESLLISALRRGDYVSVLRIAVDIIGDFGAHTGKG